jgi:hypothetical protein
MCSVQTQIRKELVSNQRRDSSGTSRTIHVLTTCCGCFAVHTYPRRMAVLEQLALQLADLPLATLLCKTFFNLSIGACDCPCPSTAACRHSSCHTLLRLTGVRANTTGMDGDADSAVMSLGECEMLQEMVRGSAGTVAAAAAACIKFGACLPPSIAT